MAESTEFNNSTHRAPLDPGSIRRLAPEEYHLAPEVLRENGVCVFTQAATQEEVDRNIALLWKWISSTGIGISRAKPETMRNENWKQLGFLESGVATKHSVGQSEFLWSVRSLPGVQNVFKSIWGTDDLVTSFDGCGMFRNPFLAETVGEDWYTKLGWFHVDQNAHISPELDTYQGLLNFFPVTTAAHGSTVVVPGSHTRFSEMFRDECRLKEKGSLVKLDKKGDFEKYCTRAVQVPLNAGDFLVWDSRTIHCNQGIDRSATAETVMGPDRLREPLARLVAYVCMLPKSRVDEDCSARRKEFVINGFTGPHHPVRFDTQTFRRNVVPGYTPLASSDPRWALVG